MKIATLVLGLIFAVSLVSLEGVLPRVVAIVGLTLCSGLWTYLRMEENVIRLELEDVRPTRLDVQA